MSLALTPEELRVLKLSDSTEDHVGSGSQEEWDAFGSLVDRGFIASIPGSDGFYRPTSLGEQALKAAAPLEN